MICFVTDDGEGEEEEVSKSSIIDCTNKIVGRN